MRTFFIKLVAEEAESDNTSSNSQLASSDCPSKVKISTHLTKKSRLPEKETNSS